MAPCRTDIQIEPPPDGPVPDDQDRECDDRCLLHRAGLRRVLRPRRPRQSLLGTVPVSAAVTEGRVACPAATRAGPLPAQPENVETRVADPLLGR
jgi:hypothetical protein